MFLSVISQSMLWPSLCYKALHNVRTLYSLGKNTYYPYGNTGISFAALMGDMFYLYARSISVQCRPQCLGYVWCSHITVNALAFTVLQSTSKVTMPQKHWHSSNGNTPNFNTWFKSFSAVWATMSGICILVISQSMLWPPLYWKPLHTDQALFTTEKKR